MTVSDVGDLSDGAKPAPPPDTYTPSARRIERERFRRARTRRAFTVATASTLVTAAVLYELIVSSPGWQRTRETFFDRHYARVAFPAVMHGLWLNLRLLAVCGVVVLVAGLLVALLRTLRGPVFFPLRALATAYVDFFRGLPLIICILVCVFGIPALRLTGVTNNPVTLGGLALCLTYTAYVAEVFRAGIESVHLSQRAAARSLGLSNAQAMRYVVLPQAVRRVIPPLLNDLVALSKDSGLISILGAIDAVRAAQIETARYANFTPYVVAGVLFVLLTFPLARFTDAFAKRSGWVGSQGALAGGGAMR